MDLGQLSNLLTQLGSHHEYLVQDFKNPIVYHYTDLNALRGIVIDRDLWLTNSSFSNDYDEGLHGDRIVQEVLEARSRRRTLKAEEQAFAKEVSKKLKHSEEQGVYVCCFCLKDELLGQWRSYGANGTGVSLGFTTGNFQFITGSDIPLDSIGLIYLWRVEYKPKAQRTIVDDCLRMAWASGTASEEERIQLAIDAIRFFVPTFKNGDFSEEREARLVFQPSTNCKVKPRFRVGRGMLVPYYSLREISKIAGRTAWQLPLTKVRIGPSPNKQINQRGVQLLLRQLGYPSVQVDLSNTPYRG